MMKSWFIVFLLQCCIFTLVIGQDLHYSQYYAAPLYLNPAMTGAMENTGVGLNYRNQWPGLDHSFNAYSAFYDHFVEKYNSGIGFLVSGSRESMANLNNVEIGILYAYRLQLRENQYLRFGGQVNYVFRNAVFSDLVFGSQIDIDRGIVIDQHDLSTWKDAHNQYLDYNFGLLWNNELFWLGTSVYHLHRPNISFLEDEFSLLATRYTVHGGVRLDLPGGRFMDGINNIAQERALFLGMNYQHQAPFNQLEVSMQVYFEPLTFGLAYRGLPVKYNLPNNEAVILLLGVSLDGGLDIGYSFDFTTSKLGIRNAGGAHEVSFRYSIVKGNPYRRNLNRSSLPFF